LGELDAEKQISECSLLSCMEKYRPVCLEDLPALGLVLVRYRFQGTLKLKTQD